MRRPKAIEAKIGSDREVPARVWSRGKKGELPVGRPRRLLRRQRRARTPKTVGVLPCSLTIGNAICGMLSITLSTSLINQVVLLTDYQRFYAAASLIFLGMLFDMFDGHVARRLQQAGAFGVQLDSLADAVSFGVAPLCLLVGIGSRWPSWLLLTVGLAYAVCTMLRLARFNVQTGDEDRHEGFVGLPSPAAAGVVASLALASLGLDRRDLPWLDPQISQSLSTLLILAMLPASAMVAVLMISNVPYRHAANAALKQGFVPLWTLALIVLLVVGVIYVRELAIAIAFCSFASVGFLAWGSRWLSQGLVYSQPNDIDPPTGAV